MQLISEKLEIGLSIQTRREEVGSNNVIMNDSTLNIESDPLLMIALPYFIRICKCPLLGVMKIEDAVASKTCLIHEKDTS